MQFRAQAVPLALFTSLAVLGVVRDPKPTNFYPVSDAGEKICRCCHNRTVAPTGHFFTDSTCSSISSPASQNDAAIYTLAVGPEITLGSNAREGEESTADRNWQWLVAPPIRFSGSMFDRAIPRRDEPCTLNAPVVVCRDSLMVGGVPPDGAGYHTTTEFGSLCNAHTGCSDPDELAAISTAITAADFNGLATIYLDNTESVIINASRGMLQLRGCTGIAGQFIVDVPRLQASIEAMLSRMI